jgi:hypothetical protein
VTEPQPPDIEEPVEEPPEPIPGLDELVAWLLTREPSIARAKIAQRAIAAIEDKVRDPAVRYAWEHRNRQATRRDLAAATGLNIARITWVLGQHPRSDG